MDECRFCYAWALDNPGVSATLSTGLSPGEDWDQDWPSTGVSTGEY